jgi:hypothetical protein
VRCRCLTCPQELLDDRRACRDATPDRMQHLLASTWWDAAAACNDVRDYVVEHLGDPGTLGWSMRPAIVRKGTATTGLADSEVISAKFM